MNIRGNGGLAGLAEQAAAMNGPNKSTPPAPDHEIAVEAADKCGMSVTRGMLPGVSLEMESGDDEGILYGAIQGRIRRNRSKGVSLIFEDAEGLWKVEIAGNNLGGLYRDLLLMRRETIRLGDCVTGIKMTAWSPPAKKS